MYGSVVGHDGDAVLVSCDGVGLGDLVDSVEVDDSLGNRLWVVVYAVAEFAVVVKDKPTALPSTKMTLE